MSFDLVHIFKEMGLVALIIVGVLTLMAMASLAVFVERLWVYARSRRQSRRLAARAGRLLDERKYEHLIREAEETRGSHLAPLLVGGLKAYLNALKKPGELGAVELTRRELARKTEAVSTDVRRGMNVLASTGSVAPFVGLLGTVVGIIDAFQGIASEGSGGLGAVSAGIAEALVVTAIGLIVAIPSVLAFNYLSARADVLLQALDQTRGEFLDYLENHTPSGTPGHNGGRSPKVPAGAEPAVRSPGMEVPVGASA